MTAYRRLIASISLVCLLLAAVSSVLPRHDHACDSTRFCGVCHTGHLPYLQAADSIELFTQILVTWRQGDYKLPAIPDATAPALTSRAPPA